MNCLESKLSNKFKKKFCVFTGSGSTAIYLILKSLNLQNKKILYPSITCMAPVNAAIYAGYEPVFCDVNLENYTMDVNALEEVIKREDIGIIVPTHIYGHRCKMDAINKLAKERNIFVLEDAAQSYYFDKSDASIISFGHTKIFQCEGGGGAVFTDDINLYNSIIEQKKQLPEKPDNIEELFNYYREDYYNIMKKFKGDKLYYYMRKLQLDNKKTFIYDLSNNENLLNLLDSYEKILEGRIKRRKLYDKYLNKNNIKLPLINQNEGLWRYTFLYKGNRDKLLEDVRAKDVDISSWYLSLHKFYSSNSDDKFKNSITIEKEIVNLWVTPQYSENKILEDINKVNKMSNCLFK